MIQSNRSSARLTPLVVVMLIATVAASTFTALWSAPTANADMNFDGDYTPPGTPTRVIHAHLHAYGVSGQDPSKPTGTLTMSNGCTIDLYEEGEGSVQNIDNVTDEVWMQGRVTSGAGPDCRDSTRERVNLVNGKVNDIHDIDNGAGWIFHD